MSDLDDLKSIRKLDRGYSLASIVALPFQCEAAWQEISDFRFPPDYRNFSSILFCGMGGSAYAAGIIKSLYNRELKVPVDLVSDYHLPAYADKNTLIIAASYSGNTEETISCVREALALEGKIIGVTTGGELKEILLRRVYPVWTIVPKYNPSMQPRLAQGYMQMGQIALLNAIGALKVEEKEVEKVIKMLQLRGKLLDVSVPQKLNIAKELAVKFKDKLVNIIGGEFLTGSIHAIRNPFHETAKHFADCFTIPEANHHLMEGLSNPSTNKDNMLFWLINSLLYSKEISTRIHLTRDVVEKNSIATEYITLSGKTPLSQVFELIQLGSFVTFYLSMLHGIDPSSIPWVNYFKEKLKEGASL